MKQILSLLLAFVFVQTQCWALSGGPVYPGDSAGVSGKYAGVLVPSGLGDNALGLFTVDSPTTGLATGEFVFFVSGGTFLGTILGLIDPDKGTFNAVTEGEQTVRRQVVNNQGAVVTVLTTIGLASGLISAELDEQISGSGRGNGAGTRLTGSGFLSVTEVDLDFFDLVPPATSTLEFTVDGFKQEDSVLGLGALAL